MIRRIDTFVEAMAAALVAASAIITCLAVFFRYVLNSALGWPEEIGGYVLVWISFLGAYLASRQNQHVSFDIVVGMLPAIPRRAVTVFVDVVLIVYFAVLLKTSSRLIGTVGATNVETVDIPFGVFMAILPLGSVLIVIALCVSIASQFKGPRR